MSLIKHVDIDQCFQLRITENIGLLISAMQQCYSVAIAIISQYFVLISVS